MEYFPIFQKIIDYLKSAVIGNNPFSNTIPFFQSVTLRNFLKI